MNHRTTQYQLCLAFHEHPTVAPCNCCDIVCFLNPFFDSTPELLPTDSLRRTGCRDLTVALILGDC